MKRQTTNVAAQQRIVQRKKWRLADELLQPSGHHARQHHSQGHEARADGVVGRAVLALREVDEVEHVGREAKSVAKLLDEDAGVDDP